MDIPVLKEQCGPRNLGWSSRSVPRIVHFSYSWEGDAARFALSWVFFRILLEARFYDIISTLVFLNVVQNFKSVFLFSLSLIILSPHSN